MYRPTLDFERNSISVDASLYAVHPLVVVSHTGYLTKLGQKVRSWKSRYFRVELNSLNYYKKEQTDKPRGLFSLVGAQVEKGSSLKNVPGNRMNAFSITVPTTAKSDNKRTYVLVCDDEYSRTRWMRAISDTIGKKAGRNESVAKNSNFRDNLSLPPNGFIEGYMTKCTRRGKKWQKRFFVLSVAEGKLRYFIRNPYGRPMGKIPLPRAEIKYVTDNSIYGVPDTSAPNSTFSVRDPETDRTLVMCANSTEDRDVWKRMIEQAIENAVPLQRNYSLSFQVSTDSEDEGVCAPGHTTIQDDGNYPSDNLDKSLKNIWDLVKQFLTCCDRVDNPYVRHLQRMGTHILSTLTPGEISEEENKEAHVPWTVEEMKETFNDWMKEVTNRCQEQLLFELENRQKNNETLLHLADSETLNALQPKEVEINRIKEETRSLEATCLRIFKKKIVNLQMGSHEELLQFFSLKNDDYDEHEDSDNLDAILEPITDIQITRFRDKAKLPEGYEFVTDFKSRAIRIGAKNHPLYICFRRRFKKSNPLITGVLLVYCDENLPYGYKVLSKTLEKKDANLNNNMDPTMLYPLRLAVRYGKGAPILGIQITLFSEFLPTGYHLMSYTPSGRIAHLGNAKDHPNLFTSRSTTKGHELKGMEKIGIGIKLNISLFLNDLAHYLLQFIIKAKHQTEEESKALREEAVTKTIGMLLVGLFSHESGIIIQSLKSFTELGANLSEHLINHFLRGLCSAAIIIHNTIKHKNKKERIRFVILEVLMVAIKYYYAKLKIETTLLIIECCFLFPKIDSRRRVSLSFVETLINAITHRLEDNITLMFGDSVQSPVLSRPGSIVSPPLPSLATLPNSSSPSLPPKLPSSLPPQLSSTVSTTTTLTSHPIVSIPEGTSFSPSLFSPRAGNLSSEKICSSIVSQIVRHVIFRKGVVYQKAISFTVGKSTSIDDIVQLSDLYYQFDNNINTNIREESHKASLKKKKQSHKRITSIYVPNYVESISELNKTLNSIIIFCCSFLLPNLNDDQGHHSLTETNTNDVHIGIEQKMAPKKSMGNDVWELSHHSIAFLKSILSSLSRSSAIIEQPTHLEVVGSIVCPMLFYSVMHARKVFEMSLNILNQLWSGGFREELLVEIGHVINFFLDFSQKYLGQEWEQYTIALIKFLKNTLFISRDAIMDIFFNYEDAAIKYIAHQPLRLCTKICEAISNLIINQETGNREATAIEQHGVNFMMHILITLQKSPGPCSRNDAPWRVRMMRREARVKYLVSARRMNRFKDGIRHIEMHFSRLSEREFPQLLAEYLFSNSNVLDRTKLGDYVANLNTKNLSKKQCEQMREAYISNIDFHCRSFSDSLRIFLTKGGFLLPGEAQKIDRMLTSFCNVYCSQNPNVFSNVNVANIISFALVMLNTDLHDTRLRGRPKMREEEFIANLRGMDEGGKDFPKEFLLSLYKDIAERPIMRLEEILNPELAAATNNMNPATPVIIPTTPTTTSGESEEWKNEKKRNAAHKDILELVRQGQHRFRKAAVFHRHWIDRPVSAADIDIGFFHTTWHIICKALIYVGENTNDLQMRAQCIKALQIGFSISENFQLQAEKYRAAEGQVKLEELQKVSKLMGILYTLMDKKDENKVDDKIIMMGYLKLHTMTNSQKKNKKFKPNMDGPPDTYIMLRDGELYYVDTNLNRPDRSNAQAKRNKSKKKKQDPQPARLEGKFIPLTSATEIKEYKDIPHSFKIEANEWIVDSEGVPKAHFQRGSNVRKTHIITAESEKDMENWMEQITQCIDSRLLLSMAYDTGLII